MSHYVMQQILQMVRIMLDRAGVRNTNPSLYDTILQNVNNPQTDLHRHFVNFLNQTTNGRWQNGINEHEIPNIIRPWLNEALNYFQGKMNHQPQGYGGYPSQQGGYQPQQQGYGNGGYSPNPIYSGGGTSGLYGGDSVRQAPIVQVSPMPTMTIQAEGNFSVDAMDLGRQVSFSLNEADTLQHHPKPGNVVSLDNYREGDFEAVRLSTIDIILNTAENNPTEAANKTLLYSPNEVLRGIYANVVTYKELVHIPIKTSEFKRIIDTIGVEFYGLSNKQKPEWRNAVKAMGSLNRAEHRMIETALLKFLNPSIFKFLRASNGDCIEGIEEIDDLNELDNPRSKFKITQHASYLNVLNEIVTRAFDTLMNPSHLIEADDKNFGDFVHCDKIEFWYDERSKYDYGTYVDKADRQKFIDTMTDYHTVLRVKKYTIITNSLEERAARMITHFRSKDSVSLKDTNNVGCKLLFGLDQPKRSEIESVVCIGDDNAKSKHTHLVNLGRTLDGHLVLIK